jgi:signal transduction histidine kinase
MSISNTGPVIPPTAVERLLQPFQRLNRRRIHHNNGHGLGLSIVQAIAAAHMADLAVNPQENGGLVVDIRFPSVSGRMADASKCDVALTNAS